MFFFLTSADTCDSMIAWSSELGMREKDGDKGDVSARGSQWGSSQNNSRPINSFTRVVRRPKSPRMFLLRPFPPKGEHEEESSTRSVGERSGEGTPAATERDADANVFFRGRRERRGCGHGHNRSPQSLPTAVPWTREPPRRERGTGGRSAFLLKGSGRDSKRMDGETLRGVFFLLASPAFFFQQ